MVAARQRSPSPTTERTSKKPKTDDSQQSQNIESCFDVSVFSQADALQKKYLSSEPYKYAIIEKLVQEQLLASVKEECINELSFSEKETDIYKINQTGDLASLSYLGSEELSRLRNLLTLRDALYSQKFRSYVEFVTGCGPLSGIKTDMSVNSYKKGCHLLNHDDVIGSRRVSYILYMPLPSDENWKAEWGGALELYDTQANPSGADEPLPIPSVSIPPSWNQFIFFEVQPGKSFHSVEEVVVDEGANSRQRLSISGWFHAAQKGENGYEPDFVQSVSHSSLEQLNVSTTVFKTFDGSEDIFVPSSSLTDAQKIFLSQYLNPVYLEEKKLQPLIHRFAEESCLELHSFLNSDLALDLETSLRQRDTLDGLCNGRAGHIPKHRTGVDENWFIKGPPHKYRFCSLSQTFLEADSPSGVKVNDLLKKLQTELFSSSAFRSWLAIVTSLVPLRYAAEVRRFRPGLDYTLATSEISESRLDVVLGLTPTAELMDFSVESDTSELVSWESGLWGGWECYMAPHDGEDDPAVYRAEPTSDSDVEDDESEEDGTLLTVSPGFNRLLLVLRDEGVMRFVKYVSSSARGSRWDICGEYQVGVLEEDDH